LQQIVHLAPTPKLDATAGRNAVWALHEQGVKAELRLPATSIVAVAIVLHAEPHLTPGTGAAAPGMDEAGWLAGNAILGGQRELVRAMQGRAIASAELALQRLALRGALVCGGPLLVASMDALTPAVFRAHVAPYTTLPATHVIVANAMSTAPASHAAAGSAAAVDADVCRQIERYGRGVCDLSPH